MSVTYMLRNRPDGQVELLQFDPRVVAVFPHLADAERVRLLLENSGTEGTTETEEAAETPSAASASETEAFDPYHRAGNALVSPVAVTAVSDATPPSDASPAEPDWEGAMTRLASGEPLRLVADEMGLPWTALRGRWAQSKQRAPRRDDTLTNCVICDREFRPSASSPDKCARCSRD